MLNFPNGGIGPYHVKGFTQQGIDMFMFGVGTMNGVMHYAHANTSHTESTDQIQKENQPNLGYLDCTQHDKGHKKQGEHHDGFDHHGCTGISAEVVVIEIG